jgi:hypothetical protein
MTKTELEQIIADLKKGSYINDIEREIVELALGYKISWDFCFDVTAIADIWDALSLLKKSLSQSVPRAFRELHYRYDT